MSKNKQILIFSGIGLAVLGGVAALLLLTAPAAPEEAPAEEKPAITLMEKGPDNITGLHIKNASGEYDIVKNGGEWTVPGLEGADILTDQLETAAANACVVKPKQLVEENADDLAKYGLSEPRAEVTARYSDGTSFTFLIGGDAPTAAASDVYFGESGKNSVYTYQGSSLSVYLNGKLDLINKQAMPAMPTGSDEEMLSFRIDRSDLEKPIIIGQMPPSDDPDEIVVFTFRVESPFVANADLTDCPTLMYSTFGLTAKSVEGYRLTDEQLAVCGLNDPQCVITIVTVKNTYTIKLGNAVTRDVTNENGETRTEVVGVYGTTSSSPDTLFIFDPANIPAISVTPDMLMSDLFLMPYIYSLKEVRYTDVKGHEFTIGFRKTKDAADNSPAEYEYFLNGEPYDDQRIKNMYQYLIGANADVSYFEDARGDKLAEVEYVYKDASRGADIVSFYSSPDDRKVVVAVDGVNICKVKQGYVDQLFLNAENFLSGGEIMQNY